MWNTLYFVCHPILLSILSNVWRHFTESFSFHLIVFVSDFCANLCMFLCDLFVSVRLFDLIPILVFVIIEIKSISSTLSQIQSNCRSYIHQEANVYILVWTFATQNKKIYMQKNTNNKLSIFYNISNVNTSSLECCMCACVCDTHNALTKCHNRRNFFNCLSDIVHCKLVGICVDFVSWCQFFFPH